MCCGDDPDEYASNDGTCCCSSSGEDCCDIPSDECSVDGVCSGNDYALCSDGTTPFRYPDSQWTYVPEGDASCPDAAYGNEPMCYCGECNSGFFWQGYSDGCEFGQTTCSTPPSPLCQLLAANMAGGPTSDWLVSVACIEPGIRACCYSITGEDGDYYSWVNI